MQSIQVVFLDRDGVLNEKAPEGEYVSDWSKFKLLPRAAQAVAELNRAGRKVIVVTNQRGIALGRYTAGDLAAIHTRLQAELAAWGAHLDAIYVCPHDKNVCDCRKPRPGLFLQAFREHPGADPKNSIMIGDSLSDVEAARRLGMPVFFIRGEKETQKAGAERAEGMADAAFDSLWDAVAVLA